MLSTTAEYALRIMITLTEADAEGEAMTSDRIAEATKVPGDYALKVMQWLSRAGMVRGQRGRGGGFRLDCDPDETTLLDVVNAVDPLERITECPLGREAHRAALCPLHARLDEVIALLEESLGDMTLTSVVEGQRGPALCEPDGRTRLRVSARGARRRGGKKKRAGRRRAR